MKATGVPPHITQLIMLDSIRIQQELITNQFHKQTMGILQTVKDAIHANDKLELKLKEHTSSVEKIIENVFEKKRLRDTNAQVERSNRLENQHNLILYNGRFFAVSKEFQFPKNMRLKQEWSCWLKGFPNYRNIIGDGNVRIVKINPFRNIRPTLLPKKIEL